MKTVTSTITLFGKRRFRAHRLCGLLYLIQFALAVISELFPPFSSLIPFLTLSLPTTALVQSIIASVTFTFLSRSKGQVQGYFSDKRTLSYEFVVENMYYSGLLLFQVVYFSHPEFIRRIPFLEFIMVFFPYFIVRPFFPKTTLRSSVANKSEISDRNKLFMLVNIYFVKTVYLTGKHISGFFLNYLLYSNNLPASYSRSLRIMFLLAGWGITISIFLHTLKFKGYLNPRVAVLLYSGAFPLFYVIYLTLYNLILTNPLVALVSFIGIPINLLPDYVQVLYQCLAYLMVHFVAS